MDNATFQRIKDLILQHQVIGIVVKPNPSLDEMAAGLGMYLVLKQMNKQATVVCSTDVIVGLSNLVGIDKVQKTFGSAAGGDLTVSFPYREGEIEKVSYTLENNLLNIVVKAGQSGLSFDNSQVQFNRVAGGGAIPTLLFTIGIADLMLISNILPSTQGVTIVNVDNKPENKNYGDVVVVSPKFSSVSEQIADFVTLLEPQIELTVDASQNLFTGISYATSDFTSQKTSYLAFEMAGILMKKGAKRQTSPVVTVPAGQPVSQFFPPIPNSPLQQQPVQPVTQPAPVQQSVQPAQQTQQAQTPADWLTPKVYKGSTIL
ncbi:MAG TPA: hypothetical protein VGT05_02475 [Patescibacteria group bacterium]|nr:hypothetical protein [Patescibacteria group bacterium]